MTRDQQISFVLNRLDYNSITTTSMLIDGTLGDTKAAALPDYEESNEIPPPWTGCSTVLQDDAFSFQTLVRERVLHALEEDLYDDLFSLSPLSSPESTPATTPICSPTPSPIILPQPLPSACGVDPYPHGDPSPLFPRPIPVPSCTTTRPPSPASPSDHGLPSANARMPGELPSTLADVQAQHPPTDSAAASWPSRAKGKDTAAARKRKKGKKDAGKANRLGKRLKETDDLFGNRPPPPTASEKATSASDPIYTATDTKRAKVVSTAYKALNRETLLMKVYYLDDLVGEGSEKKFDLQEWDGITPIAIVDRDGRIIAILAGRPDDPTWEEVLRSAEELLQDAQQTCRVPKGSDKHRRGAFTTLRCGFSHGGGQEQPQNHANNKTNTRVLQRLNSSKAMRRVAGFGSSVLQSWAPKLHAYYIEKLGSLQRHDPGLKRPFRNSVFPATTYNLGPQTVCYPHIDFANLPYGFCAITAFGSFDSKKGGHLVLWECGLVVEFPAGSTILIPSAIIHHSNIAVSPSETRFSATQYAAGGLFRWVDHKFQKTAPYRASLSPEELGKLDKENAQRWAFGLSLLPRLPSVSTS